MELNQKELEKMTVTQLRAVCLKMELETKGNKLQLLDRLRLHQTMASIGKAEENGENPSTPELVDAIDDMVGEEEEEPMQTEEKKEDETEAAGEKKKKEEKKKYDPVEFETYSWKQIRKACTRRKLECKGSKSYVVMRLEAYQSLHGPMAPESEDEEEPKKVAKVDTTPAKKSPDPVTIPAKTTAKKEMYAEQRVRSLVFGPLTKEDLKKDAITQMLDKSVQYAIHFHKWDDGSSSGYVRIRFASYEEAEIMAEMVPTIKSGVLVRQLNTEDKGVVHVGNKMAGNPRGENEEELDERTLYVHNVPATATEEAVKKLFPGAVQALVMKTTRRDHKGYAYVTFYDSKKAQDCLYTTKSTKYVLEDKELKLFKMAEREPNEAKTKITTKKVFKPKTTPQKPYQSPGWQGRGGMNTSSWSASSSPNWGYGRGAGLMGRGGMMGRGGIQLRGSAGPLMGRGASNMGGDGYGRQSSLLGGFPGRGGGYNQQQHSGGYDNQGDFGGQSQRRFGGEDQGQGMQGQGAQRRFAGEASSGTAGADGGNSEANTLNLIAGLNQLLQTQLRAQPATGAAARTSSAANWGGRDDGAAADYGAKAQQQANWGSDATGDQWSRKRPASGGWTNDGGSWGGQRGRRF